MDLIKLWCWEHHNSVTAIIMQWVCGLLISTLHWLYGVSNLSIQCWLSTQMGPFCKLLGIFRVSAARTSGFFVQLYDIALFWFESYKTLWNLCQFVFGLGTITSERLEPEESSVLRFPVLQGPLHETCIVVLGFATKASMPNVSKRRLLPSFFNLIVLCFQSSSSTAGNGKCVLTAPSNCSKEK